MTEVNVEAYDVDSLRKMVRILEYENKLLKDKLPDTLDDKQKESKVRNLLKKLKSEGIITTDSDNKRLANWVLKK